MFKRYQKLIVNNTRNNFTMEVYFLAEYLGYAFTVKANYPTTMIICENINTKEIFHIKASDIVDIIDGID